MEHYVAVAALFILGICIGFIAGFVVCDEIKC